MSDKLLEIERSIHIAELRESLEELRASSASAIKYLEELLAQMEASNQVS